MKKILPKITGIIALVMMACSLCLAGVMSVKAAEQDIPANIPSDSVPDIQLESLVPKGITPKAGWNVEQWKIYKRRIAQTIDTATQKVYYMAMDDVAMTDYKLYFVKDSYYNSIDDTQSFENEEKYIKVPQSEDYPGCFILSKTPSDLYEKGEFYVYEKDETDAKKYLFMDNDYITADGESVDVRHCYTLSFTQGDIDTKQLPNVHYYWSGQEIRNPWYSSSYMSNGHSISDTLREYYNTDFYTGGYGIDYWEDQDGEKYDPGYSSKTVTKKTILHPVYQNEQDMDLQGKTVTIDSAEDFLRNVDSESKNVLIVDKNIVIDAAAVNAYRGTDSELPSFKWSNGLVVVTENGTLTFDGVNASCSNTFSVVMLSVQSGGKVIMKNRSSAYRPNEDYGLFISLQENATMEMEDSRGWALYGLHNHGTIHVKEPATPSDTYSGNSAVISVGRDFFNAKEGTLQIDWAKVDIHNDYERSAGERKMYDAYSEEDFYERYIPNVNRGQILIKGKGGMILSGTSSEYQHDRTIHIPFMNQGTIICKSAPPEPYHGSPFEVEYSVIQNMKGASILIEQPEHKARYGTSLRDYLTSSNAGLEISSSVFINEGELSVKAVSELGILVNGLYFNPEKYINQLGAPQSDEIQYARIENRKSGTMILESDKDSLALSVRDQCVLDNAGTITIKNTDATPKINNVTLASCGMICNEGSIVNNGGIGFDYTYNYTEMFEYKGNAVTGSGTLCLQYYVNMYDENENSLPNDVTAPLVINGETVTTLKGSESYYAFFPMNSVFKATAKASGYKDGTCEIKTASSIADYKGNDKYNRVSGFHITMSKGSGSNTDNNGNGGGNTANKGSAGSKDKETGNVSGNGSSAAPADNKAPVQAADGNKATTTKNGEATITEIKATTKKSVSVPANVTIRGVKYKVTTIQANAFKNCKKATTVTLPNTVTKIKANAFAKSKISTVKITLKKGAKISVDKKAFKKSKVKKVQITMSKKDKKKKASIIKAFTKAGIKKSKVKVKMK